MQKPNAYQTIETMVKRERANSVQRLNSAIRVFSDAGIRVSIPTDEQYEKYADTAVKELLADIQAAINSVNMPNE